MAIIRELFHGLEPCSLQPGTFRRPLRWPACTPLAMKRKYHFDEIFITGCTESCHFDKMDWHQLYGITHWP